MDTLYMICNRDRNKAGEFGDDRIGVRFYTCQDTDAKNAAAWTQMSSGDFVRAIGKVAANFPSLPDNQQEDQCHISLFVHGYNVGWIDGVDRFLRLRQDLFTGPNSMGLPILLSWPSNGSVAAYLADRQDAEDSAPALAEMFVQLNGQLLVFQRVAAKTGNPADFCKAKISVIAHSMGNYVVQKALAIASKRLNNPSLVTLINQLVMVAADVDNDIFEQSKPIDSDGSLMANLCYRVAALYTGFDQVLGASAGLKHFGTRRLGRSGLADRTSVWDNVFDYDVSALITPGPGAHSAVFESKDAIELLRRILRGVDRKHLGAPA
jgi:hypothetical protein